MHSTFLSSLFLLIGFAAVGQSIGTIKGRITDSRDMPLAFATVYEEGTTNGTTSNADGYYQLSMSAGTKQVIAQFVGYEKQSKQLTIIGSETQQVNFQLQDETLVLQEVVVSAKEKDHARQIIRNTIRKRKYYRDEVAAFSCDVYVKGLQRLDKKPKSLLGLTIDIDTGIVYLSESVSKIKYLHPDHVNEVMVSSKVSGNNNAFSYNQASEMLINLYDNSFFVEGLSERPFVSPIASNAFLYYDYKMAGTMVENGLFINKIRVIPKRNTDPVVSGYLYIIEDSWRLHSVDVMTTKSNGIDFLDSLTFNQVFAPVGHDIWMPISQRFTFKFKAFGFLGSGHFTAVYRNYKVQPNYYIATPATKAEKKEAKKQKKVKRQKKAKSTPKVPTTDTLITTPKTDEDIIVKRDEPPLFTKKDFSKALLVVEEHANNQDSAYWASVRPIPLTPKETRDYAQKDSIRSILESKAYKDSLDVRGNKFRAPNLLMYGYTHRNSYQRNYFNFPTLPEAFQYNSVEGMVLNLPLVYQKRTEHSVDYRLVPTIRYGFENKQFQAQLEGLKMLNLKKREMLQAAGGRFVEQLNSQNPISYTNNSYFTLLEGDNYAKLYQKYFGFIAYQTEVSNGLLIAGRIDYMDRTLMTNTASYNVPNNEFDSNAPPNAEIEDTSFPNHQALTLTTRVRIRFNQTYIDRPERKIILNPTLPTLFISAKLGIPTLGSDVNYSLVKLGLQHKIMLGQWGSSDLTTWGGLFLGNKTVFFPDFQHFNGNRTYLTTQGIVNRFQVLDYYRFSTQDKFVEAHYEHHFNEFIFNKIPLVRKLDLQAVASLNYLSTPAIGHYLEFGGGIEHIFKFIRVDYFTAIRNGHHYGSGIRVGLGF